MFDNPKKELERLQQELLDAEKQPEDYYTDEDLEADLEDPSEWEGDDRAPLSQSCGPSCCGEPFMASIRFLGL